MTRYFVGCDPRVHGALAAITEDREVVFAESLPIIRVPKAASYRSATNKNTGEVVRKRVHGYHTFLDFQNVGLLVDRICALAGPAFVYLEKVSARPTDGVVQAFTFGGSLWAMQQAFCDRKISYELVSPQRWQHHMLGRLPKGTQKKDRKRVYVHKAKLMFPSALLDSDSDRAAALLLAEYGRQTQGAVYDRETIHPGG